MLAQSKVICLFHEGIYGFRLEGVVREHRVLSLFAPDLIFVHNVGKNMRVSKNLLDWHDTTLDHLFIELLRLFKVEMPNHQRLKLLQCLNILYVHIELLVFASSDIHLGWILLSELTQIEFLFFLIIRNSLHPLFLMLVDNRRVVGFAPGQRRLRLSFSLDDSLLIHGWKGALSFANVLHALSEHPHVLYFRVLLRLRPFIELVLKVLCF